MTYRLADFARDMADAATTAHAAWIDSDVVGIARDLAPTTTLAPLDPDYARAHLGLATPWVSASGLAYDAITLGFEGGTGTWRIVAVPTAERVSQWYAPRPMGTVGGAVVVVSNGRARPDTLDGFIDPTSGKPGITPAEATDLARFVAACLQLMASPTVTVASDREVTVAGKGRCRRSGSLPVQIRTHSLIRHVRSATRGGGEPATRRWWVRGHFRNQPYGPGRTLRRRVFIAPHTAGARGLPEPELSPAVDVYRVGG